MLYGRLDDLREQTSKRLAQSLRQTGGTHQMRSERDTSVAMYTDQLAQYSAVENGLAFGRLDFHNEDRFYIGRIGLFDEDKEYEPLLMDWRAPAARPFYLATAASPDGVRRRRHLRTRSRKARAPASVIDTVNRRRSLSSRLRWANPRTSRSSSTDTRSLGSIRTPSLIRFCATASCSERYASTVRWGPRRSARPIRRASRTSPSIR